MLLPQRTLLRALLSLPDDALASIPRSAISIISNRTRRVLNHVREHCDSLALPLCNDRDLLQDDDFAVHDKNAFLHLPSSAANSSASSTGRRDDEDQPLDLAALMQGEVQELNKDTAILVHELIERLELAITFKIFNSGLIRKRLDALGELSKAMWVIVCGCGTESDRTSTLQSHFRTSSLSLSLKRSL